MLVFVMLHLRGTGLCLLRSSLTVRGVNVATFKSVRVGIVYKHLFQKPFSQWGYVIWYLPNLGKLDHSICWSACFIWVRPGRITAFNKTEMAIPRKLPGFPEKLHMRNVL